MGDVYILGDPSKGSLCDRLKRLDARGVRLDPPAYPYGDENERLGVVLVASCSVPRAGSRKASVAADPASTEDDEAGSFTGAGEPVTLAEHTGHVESWVADLARRAGLRDIWRDDLALAAALHDAGKADERFQLLLAHGDPFALEPNGAALAKSGRGRSAPGAWERAGLPERWRHEALSVRLALVNPRLDEAHDRALVLWLIGSHHGRGRPFFPHADEWDRRERELPVVEGLVAGPLPAGDGPQSLAFVIPEEARFGPREGRGEEDDLRGLDWPTLFRDLKRRYGPWGLARLEAVLRLADHRASAAGSGPGGAAEGEAAAERAREEAA